MKLSFRTRASYSITQVGEPCTLNSEDFVKAVPPYKGETEEDFWNYINDNLSDWEAEEYIEDNEGILSDELLNTLYNSFVDYPTDIMFDSRNNFKIPIDIIAAGIEAEIVIPAYNPK